MPQDVSHPAPFNPAAWEALQTEIVTCRQCPRLVDWREQVAREKVKRHAEETYWGRPAPCFGDPLGRLLVVGLAPAAHGANRTGRLFTGDRSGDWLYRALHRAGFANQPTSTHRDDGLTLTDCSITALLHCAPPLNKPLREEQEACAGFLTRELALLPNVQVVVALGKLAYDAMAAHLKGFVHAPMGKKPAFAHGVAYRLSPGLTLLGSYHPSQQNTFTGKLTEPMLDAVFNQVRALLTDTTVTG